MVMARQKIIFPFLLICFSANTSQAQSYADIERFEKEEKSCLDTSRAKTGCVVLFKKQMDSLLAVAYNGLLNTGTGSEREGIVKEQAAWLEQQKEFNQRTDEQYNLEVTEKDFGETAATMVLSEKADFVRDRVKNLLERQKRSARTAH